MENATLNLTEIFLPNYGLGSAVDVLRYIWFLGIAVSVLGILIQVFFFSLFSESRKFDQKVLFQLSIAKLISTSCEHVICITPIGALTREIFITFYMLTDWILFLLEYVFAKNLYDKVVIAYTMQKVSLTLLSGAIWTSGILIGIFRFYLEKKYKTYVKLMQFILAGIKLFILVMNILFFSKIFKVVVTRRNQKDQNMSAIIKICAISFALVCITTLQGLLSVIMIDIYLHFISQFKNFTYRAFCVANSFQIVVITVIFVVLVKNGTDDNVMKSVKQKLLNAVPRRPYV